jgi:hypothetical protein
VCLDLEKRNFLFTDWLLPSQKLVSGKFEKIICGRNIIFKMTWDKVPDLVRSGLRKSKIMI